MKLVPEVGWGDFVAAVLVAGVYVGVNGWVPEPARQRFNAVMIAGAGAAYLSSGFGWGEFAFSGVLTALAYLGLGAYRFIGAGWLLHVGWDLAHHFWADPIVWCVPTSSAQCAVCDSLLALWFFAGAPSVWKR